MTVIRYTKTKRKEVKANISMDIFSRMSVGKLFPKLKALNTATKALHFKLI